MKRLVWTFHEKQEFLDSVLKVELKGQVRL